MSEFDELIIMLDKSGIPYERDDDNYMMLAFGTPVGGIRRIKYPKKEDFVCSVIFGHGTYGYEDGKLEIMGLLTPEEEQYDSVLGYLTAKNVPDNNGYCFLNSKIVNFDDVACGDYIANK